MLAGRRRSTVLASVPLRLVPCGMALGIHATTNITCYMVWVFLEALSKRACTHGPA